MALSVILSITAQQMMIASFNCQKYTVINTRSFSQCQWNITYV